MTSAPLPKNEKARLGALHRYQLLDGRPEELFNDFTRLASEVCSTPVAILSVVEAHRVSYKSKVGIKSGETTRKNSFCSWAILEPELLIIPDAAQDARFSNNPLVTARPGIRFYAGAPLVTSDGYALGVLAVIDRRPRQLTAPQMKALRTLASAVVSQLELRRKSLDLEQAVVERQKAYESLAASEQRYSLVIKSANDGLWDWNLETNEMTFCPRWKAILGYKDEEIGSRPDEWLSRVHPEDMEQVQAALTSHLLGSTPHFVSEHRVKRRDGLYRWVLSRGLAVWDAARSLYRMAGSMTDVTEQKETEKQLLHNAYHDVLTGLPNRALFMDRLKRSLARSKHGNDYLFAVLFLDLDRFKVVNDSLGHQVGDQLLVGVARRLHASLRPGDMVARLGGDEFAVVLDHLKSVNDATLAAERIQRDLAAPFNLSGHEVFISASIGISLNLTPCDEPSEMIRNADTAMYRAKEDGRGRFELFDKGMHENAIARLRLETDLRRAISRNEFRVHYQPIVSLESWRIAGFEALLRWEHPEHGWVSPLQFIPVAEETGLVITLGQWILREACRQLREWQQLFPSEPPLTMSVNLSGKQFTQPDLIERISQILQETGVEPRSLKIEITESAIIENIEAAEMILKELKALGIRLSLDDFGTGYSSLSYLHRFPIDTLKIDRSFVTRMSLPKNSEIIRTIITLAVNLGMDVIAEGVESRDQVIQLTGLNCEYVQGYLMSKPVDGEAMRALIEETYQRGLGNHPTSEPCITIPADDFLPGVSEQEQADELCAGSFEVVGAAASHEAGQSLLAASQPPIKFMPAAQDLLSGVTGSADENRRRVERFNLSIPARVIGYDRKGGKWEEMTHTTDVSKTGITVSLKKRPRNGTILHLMLPLPAKLRNYSESDPNYKIYGLVTRVEPSDNGSRLVAVEFIGPQPPSAYQEKPWAIFQPKKWRGTERRREQRDKRRDLVTVEFLDSAMQPIKQDIALMEDRSSGGMRVRLKQPPPEFDMLRVIEVRPGGEYIAVVRNQFVGKDGFERLCLRLTGQSVAHESPSGLPS
jgi:diguanylate cyclase (GGDEF)-like protein/PAS domain S-box-containing protein